MAKEKEALPSAAEARAVLERGLRTLRMFQDADKAVAVLENLEQVTKERQVAADALKAEVERVRGEVLAAEGELQESKRKAKELVDAAGARASKHESDAKDYAGKVTKEADDRAAKVRSETDALVAECLERQAELKDLEKQAEQARVLIQRAEKVKAAMQ
jgi:hypothetical protein